MMIRWATDSGPAINVTKGAGWAFRAYAPTPTPSFPTDTMWHTGATDDNHSLVTLFSIMGRPGSYYNSIGWTPNHTWTYGVAKTKFEGITAAFPIYTEAFAQAFGRQVSINYAGCQVTFVHITNCSVDSSTREVTLDPADCIFSQATSGSNNPRVVYYDIPEATNANWWTFVASDFRDDVAIAVLTIDYDDPQIWYQGRMDDTDAISNVAFHY